MNLTKIRFIQENFYSALRNLFSPIPVKPLKMDKIGDNKLKKQNGKNAKVDTPNVLATKAPATPQGIK